MPGFQHYVSVHPYPFPLSVSALPFRSAVAVSVPWREQIRKTELDPIWTETANLRQRRTLFST